jgi:hypothetical protein
MSRILLAILIAGLGGLAYLQTTDLRQQARQIQELAARLDSIQSKTASADLQDRCAKQARVEFEDDQAADEKLGLARNQVTQFENHYNAKLGKCFVKLESWGMKEPIQISVRVIDAFESKGYAMYLWQEDKNKKASAVPPFQCKVTMPSGEERVCRSDDEFDVLIKQYMEE